MLAVRTVHNVGVVISQRCHWWPSGHAQSLQDIVDYFKELVALDKVVVDQVDEVVGVRDRVDDPS